MIVIYKSKTGFSEKYARAIASELECEVINIKEVNKKELNKHDIVIYGSRVHAGRIDGLNKMKKLLDKGIIKRLIVFATGGTPNAAKDLVNKLWNDNLSEEEKNKIAHFYMQSGICYEKMGFIDRMIMKMAAKMMETKKDKDNNEEGFVNAISKSYDISSYEYIKELVKYIKKEM